MSASLAPSLLDSISEYLTPDLLGRAASALGENPAGVSRAVGAAVPMLLSGIATKATDPNFASSLFKMVNDPSNDGGMLGDLGRALAPGAATTPMGALGGKLLNSLFGGNLNGATSALAGHAGIRPASAASLMTFAAPVILSVLGKSVRSGGLSLPSLIGMLTGQKSALAAALPAGFGLDRLLGSAERVAPAMAAAVEPARKSSVLRWLLPLIGVVIAGLLLSRCNANKDARVQTPAPTVTMEVTAAAAAPAAALFFDVGATALPADGATRLAPMVDYLKSHPGAVAVVSGYHDPTGDQAVNDELAKNRAMAVRDALMASGVEESRIDLQKPADTEGGGSTEAARRVEVTIR